MANLAVTSLAMDPTKPDVIYAGTGEGFFNVDALRGAGLFRTTDGVPGASSRPPRPADFATVNRARHLERNGKVAARRRHGPGIFRSSDARAPTWTTVLTERVADVKFHPTDPTPRRRRRAGRGQA